MPVSPAGSKVDGAGNVTGDSKLTAAPPNPLTLSGAVVATATAGGVIIKNTPAINANSNQKAVEFQNAPSQAFTYWADGHISCGSITTSGISAGSGNGSESVAGGVADGASAIGVKISNASALSTAGAKIAAFYSDLATTEKLAVGKNGQFITPTGNADSVVGTATLSGGTVTVSTTAVTAASKIFLTYATAGGTQGFLRQGAIVAATSFVITSSSGTDTSTVNWWVVN